MSRLKRYIILGYFASLTVLLELLSAVAISQCVEQTNIALLTGITVSLTFLLVFFIAALYQHQFTN